MSAGRSATDVHDDRRRPPAAGRAARPRATPRRRGRGPRSWTPSKPSSATRRRRSPPPTHGQHRDRGSPTMPSWSCSWTCPTPDEAAGPAHRRTPPRVTIPPIPIARTRLRVLRPARRLTDPGRRARPAPEDGSGNDDPVRLKRSRPDEAQPLTEVLPPRATATWKPVELSVTQRHDLIEVWTTMFTDVYVHYTQKRALYGFDPIRALSALRRQIPYLDSAGFLRELTLLINRLRDQHTQLYVDAADRNAHRLRRGAALPRRALRIAPLTDLRRHQDHRRRRTTPTSPSAPASRPGTASRSPEPSTCTPKPSPEDAPTPGAPGRSKPSPNDRSQYLPPPDELWVDIGYRLDTDERRRPRSQRSGSSGEPSSPPRPSPPTT